MSFFKSFARSFYFSEPGMSYMWAILLVGCFGLAIIIERSIFLLRRSSFKPALFMDKIFSLIQKNSLPEAITLCRHSAGMALAQIIRAGLENAGQGADRIRNAIEESTLHTVPVLEKRTNFLGTVANVATLLGLMGTIYGLILAFAAVGAPGIDPAQKSALLAQGIAAAMNTTLLGLAVAIPCITIYTYLSSKTQKIIDDIDEHSLKLVNLLTERAFKVHRYFISTAQIKEGVGLHITHRNVKIFTDNNLIKEVSF